MDCKISILSALVIPLLLTGCGSQDGFPSLARRDAERISGSAEPVTPSVQPMPETKPSPELETRLAQLVGDAKAAHENFLAQRDEVERIISANSGAVPASDGWSNAQVALASLEAARSEGPIALAELDRLYAEERIAHPEGPTAAAIAMSLAREEVQYWVKQQDADLDRANAVLAGSEPSADPPS